MFWFLKVTSSIRNLSVLIPVIRQLSSNCYICSWLGIIKSMNITFHLAWLTKWFALWNNFIWNSICFCEPIKFLKQYLLDLLIDLFSADLIWFVVLIKVFSGKQTFLFFHSNCFLKLLYEFVLDIHVCSFLYFKDHKWINFNLEKEQFHETIFSYKILFLLQGDQMVTLMKL